MNKETEFNYITELATYTNNGEQEKVIEFIKNNFNILTPRLTGVCLNCLNIVPDNVRLHREILEKLITKELDGGANEHYRMKYLKELLEETK